MLINSTLKDIPLDYQNREDAIVKQFVGAYGGCGKERNMSQELCETSIQKEALGLDEFLAIETEEEAELVIIVASTEGGTGSGSAPLIANYIRNVYGIAVHVFALIGFEDDTRGMRNTVEFFKEIKENLTVECMKNSKFLPSCNNNRLKAEKEANIEFCKKISVLMGLQIRDSDHNIDPTDLFKLSTEEGYMDIETAIFTDKIKNAEQFKQTLIDTLDNSKALDTADTTAVRKLGIIINIKPENTDYIQYRDVLAERFGVAYEIFEHIQHESDMPEFISIIVSGMKMPTDEIESIYKNYQKNASKINRTSDDFFSTIQEKDIDSDDDSRFNLKSKKTKTINKEDFFKKDLGVEFSNTRKKMIFVDSDPTSEY
jgi:cell division GTPase FtsZ